MKPLRNSYSFEISELAFCSISIWTRRRRRLLRLRKAHEDICFAVIFRYFLFIHHHRILNRLSFSLLLLFVVYCQLIKIDWYLVWLKIGFGLLWCAMWITIEWYLVFVLFFGWSLMLVGYALCVCVLVSILPIFVSVDASQIRCGVFRCQTPIGGHPLVLDTPRVSVSNTDTYDYTI